MRLRACTLTIPPPPRLNLAIIVTELTNTTQLRLQWQGKAPPIDPFSAEGLDEHDWLPTFERVAEWNNWSDSECLLQLAGHLKDKARQEFSRGEVDFYNGKNCSEE